MKSGSELVREAGAEMTATTRPDSQKLVKKLKREEVQGLCQYLVEDPIYLENFQKRLRAGLIAPPIEAMVWGYAFGRPKERVEVQHAAVVKIIHEVVGGEGPRVIEGAVVQAEEPDVQS